MNACFGFICVVTSRGADCVLSTHGSYRGQTGLHGRLAVLSAQSRPSRARRRARPKGPGRVFPSGRVCLSVPNVDLPPLCSSRFRSGPPGEEAQVASQFVADVVEK